MGMVSLNPEWLTESEFIFMLDFSFLFALVSSAIIPCSEWWNKETDVRRAIKKPAGRGVGGGRFEGGGLVVQDNGDFDSLTATRAPGLQGGTVDAVIYDVFDGPDIFAAEEVHEIAARRAVATQGHFKLDFDFHAFS